MIDVIICTVGTSILTINKDLDKDPSRILQRIKNLQINNTQLGAEINSNFSIINTKNLVDPEIYFCIGDSNDDDIVAEIFKEYYKSKNIKTHFYKIEGLKGRNHHEFKNIGLKNLVRTVAEIIKNAKAKNVIPVINATGGFKAQISFAALIGQLLSVSVFYMFELFPEVIEIPPLPMSFDFNLCLQNYELFKELHENGFIEENKLPYNSLTNEIKVLIENYDSKYILNDLGTLFYEGFIQNFFQNKHKLLPPNTNIQVKDKEMKYEDKNPGKHPGLTKFIEKIFKQKYVTGAFQIYFNKSLVKRGFRIDKKDKINTISCYYSDDKSTSEVKIYTTAENESHQSAILIDLENTIS